MRPVGLDIARIVDQIDRGCREAEYHEGQDHLDQDLAEVVVVAVVPESGHRCGEDEDVLHPLPRPQRLDDAGGQVLRRAGGREGFFAHSSVSFKAASFTAATLRATTVPTATPVSTSVG